MKVPHDFIISSRTVGILISTSMLVVFSRMLVSRDEVAGGWESPHQPPRQCPAML